MSNCNCEPKTYNIGMGCCQPVLGDIRNYYTKYQIDRMIESATTSGCCITPEEVDDKIASAKTDIESEIPSLSGYATEQWVLDKGYITGVDLSNYATLEDIPDLTDYALKSEIPSLSGYATEQWVEDKHYITGVDLSDYATTAYVNTQISSQTGDFVTGEQLSSYTYSKAVIDSKIASGGTFDPTQYYNKTETDNLLDNKLDVSAYTPTDLSDYYTKSETNNQISSATADMATKTWVGQQGYLTEHQSLSGYATQQWVSGYTYDKQTIDDKVAQGGSFDPTQYYNKTEVDNKIASAKTEIEGEIPSLNGYATQQWVEDKHYITGVDLSNYATKSEIPTVPTNVSAFNNDAGYLTEHQSLSAYSTTSEVNNLINQATSGKANSSDVITNIKSNPSKGKAAISYTKNGTNTNVDVFETPVGSGLKYDKATKQLSLNLVAGTNVSISNNVISATDTTYSAGDGIQISGNTISTTTKFQCLTEQEWASVSGNPDTNTVYFIR